MKEINNPEQQTDKPSAEQSPEKLRAAEGAKKQRDAGFDSNSERQNITNKTSPEKKPGGMEQPSTPEKQREQRESSKNVERNNAGVEKNEVSEPKLRNTEKTLSGRELTAEEKEVNNKFRGDQFEAKNSFNESVPPEKRKELVDANAATTCKLNENLSGKESTNEKYQSKMTDAQKEKVQELKDMRKDVPEIKEDTVMQKVITEKDYQKYTSGEYNNIRGCVAKAEDAAPYTNNMKQAYDNLRLDYGTQDGKNPHTEAANNKGDMYVMRVTSDYSPSNKEYPKASEGSKPPCTDTGYTGSKEHLIPEYQYPKDGAPITDGAIYKVDHMGNETLVATWDGKKFKEIE